MGNSCMKVSAKIDNQISHDNDIPPKPPGRIVLRRHINKGKTLWKCREPTIGERQSYWAPGQEIAAVPFNDIRNQLVIMRCGI